MPTAILGQISRGRLSRRCLGGSSGAGAGAAHQSRPSGIRPLRQIEQEPDRKYPFPLTPSSTKRGICNCACAMPSWQPPHRPVHQHRGHEVHGDVDAQRFQVRGRDVADGMRMARLPRVVEVAWGARVHVRERGAPQQVERPRLLARAILKRLLLHDDQKGRGQMNARQGLRTPSEQSTNGVAT
jgi:hypothetical protein